MRRRYIEKKRKHHKPLTSINLSKDIFNLILKKEKGKKSSPNPNTPPPPHRKTRTEKTEPLRVTGSNPTVLKSETLIGL